MSIVINGKKIETPGLQTISWLDDPKVPKATDLNPREMWIRAIVLHTVHGKSGRLLPGLSRPNLDPSHPKLARFYFSIGPKAK